MGYCAAAGDRPGAPVRILRVETDRAARRPRSPGNEVLSLKTGIRTCSLCRAADAVRLAQRTALSPYPIAESACPMSAIRSFWCSRPIDSLIMLGVRPAAQISSSAYPL